MLSFVTDFFSDFLATESVEALLEELRKVGAGGGRRHGALAVLLAAAALVERWLHGGIGGRAPH